METRVWMVTLSWNGRAATLACLESIARQSLQPEVVLVIDNGSSDGLEEPLRRRFPHVRYVPLRHNIGFAGGMNLGIRQALAAGADYVFTTSNATIFDPRCLAFLVRALADAPRAAACAPKIFLDQPPGHIYYHGGYFTRATLNPAHQDQFRPDPAPEEAAPRETDFLNGCSPLYRCSALRQAGGYDASFTAYFEDADLSLRLRRAGWQLLVSPQARATHKESTSYRVNAGKAMRGKVSPAKWFLMTRNRLWLLRKHGTPWQRMLGFGFVLCSRLGLVPLQVLRGRPRKAGAVLRGLGAGMFSRLRPDTDVAA